MIRNDIIELVKYKQDLKKNLIQLRAKLTPHTQSIQSFVEQLKLFRANFVNTRKTMVI